MSTLKQEILAQVQKGENVLQSADSGAGTPNKNEGNIYECRFEATEYNPATGVGVNTQVGDLRKYTRELTNGDTKTFVIDAQVEQQLTYNNDASGAIGMAGELLDVNTYITKSVQFKSDVQLLKNGSKYFTRSHGAITNGGPSTPYTGVAELDTTGTTSKVFLGSTGILEDSWANIAAAVFTSAGTTSATATQGQLIFDIGGEARNFTKNFIGKIAADTVIPAGTIFYYDGGAIFNDGTSNALGAGYYLYEDAAGADLDVATIVDMANNNIAIFYDAASLAAAATAPTKYVLTKEAGAGVTFNVCKGHASLDSAEIKHVNKVWTETMAGGAQVTVATAPEANNEYWKLAAAASEPVGADESDTDGAKWQKTTADDLDNNTYWNKVSESFVEDHDIPVGVLGLVGADDGGEYSNLDAAGDLNAGYAGYTPDGASNTYRVNEIESTSTAGTNTPVEVKTEFRHGLEPGDQVTIAGVEDGAGAAIAEVNGTHTVGRIGGSTGTDAFVFELEGTDLTTLGVGNVPQSAGKGTVSATAIRHLFWGAHNPPTTDQALVYRH